MNVLTLIGCISLYLFTGIVDSWDFFPLRNFDTGEYQAETQNWDICQDDSRIIYVANNKGLLEFNGETWHLYPSPNQTILRSVCVSGKSVYTGCYMEFGFWQRDQYNVLQYTSLSKQISDQFLEDETFWKIVTYEHWILFQSLHRIYIYDSLTQSFQIISSEPNLPKIFQLDNQIYFQKMGEGLFKLVNATPILISDSPVFKDNIIINIFSLNTRFLVQTQEKGIYVIDDGKVSQWQKKDTPVLNSLSIYCSTHLRNGGFVFGTIGRGVYFMSEEGEITKHIDKLKGLQNNTVLSLFQDDDNNIWLGLDNGISVINPDSPIRIYYDTRGVFGNVYASAYYNGFLYLGTNQGLYYRDANQDEDFKLVKGTDGQVWILQIIDGTLFCGHNSGTFIVNRDNAQLICNQMGTWNIKPIEGKTNLILQGNYEGLFVLKKENGKWQFRNKIEGFNISSRYFELMPQNRIFVNHENKGVYRLVIDSDFTKAEEINIVSTASPCFYSGMAKYDEKLLYFTNDGMFEYGDDGEFSKNQLLTDKIFKDDSFASGKMVVDDNKTLWLFTNNNILALSHGRLDSEPSIERIAIPLAMRENVVGFENLLHLSKDNYLLGTTNGYILFSPSDVTSKVYKVSINSIELLYSGKESRLIPFVPEKPRFESEENHIRFCYSVPAFQKFEPVQYRYKLSGNGDNWSEWSDEAEAVFNNLSSGDYCFEVQAKIGNNYTKESAIFCFSIATPWYIRWWMIVVYSIVTIGILGLINLLYKIRYEKKAKAIRQEKLLNELKTEKEIIKLKHENLNNEVESKKRELASTTMAVVKKNELLNDIRTKLRNEVKNAGINAALNIIDEHMDNNSDWEAFQEAFNNTDRDFLKKLKDRHPSLTSNDLKLCVYLRLNFSSKEIAPMLNISPQSVEIKRFRLRKKMNLSHESNLTDYILSI